MSSYLINKLQKCVSKVEGPAHAAYPELLIHRLVMTNVLEVLRVTMMAEAF